MEEEMKIRFSFLFIVHGNHSKLDHKEVEQVEELLRKSIKLWIEDKKTFLHKIATSGKATEDGRLNTVFFE